MGSSRSRFPTLTRPRRLLSSTYIMMVHPRGLHEMHRQRVDSHPDHQTQIALAHAVNLAKPLARYLIRHQIRDRPFGEDGERTEEHVSLRVGSCISDCSDRQAEEEIALDQFQSLVDKPDLQTEIGLAPMVKLAKPLARYCRITWHPRCDSWQVSWQVTWQVTWQGAWHLALGTLALGRRRIFK
jgi:hypothetical protein